MDHFGTKWLDLKESQIDLDGTHAGPALQDGLLVHQNCQWGVLRGQKCPKNTMNQSNLATSGIG